MAQLELLVSPPGTGKTSHCIDVFRKEILKSKAGIDSRAYFILPNREHAGRIQSLILKKEIIGLFNAHILTIDDLTNRFLGAKAALKPGDVVREAILRSILEDSQKPWRYFESVKHLNGFHRLLAETVQEFKANLLTVETFEKAAKSFFRDAVLGAKAADFIEVMKRYEERMEALGLAEPEDNIRHLLSEQDSLEKTSLLIFDGFYHFTPAQRALIEVATQHAERILVTLSLGRAWKERLFAFEYPKNTRDFLQKLGFKESRTKFVVNHRTNQAALKHLEKNIFLGKPAPFAGAQEAVQILAADNTRAEMETIAREIRKIHREEPVHYSDICVIFRTLGPRQKILEQVFREYEIPFHAHERKKLLESGWARLVYRWLRLYLDGWKKEDLFFLLKSNYVSLPVDDRTFAEFEKAALSRNLLEGKQAWLDLISEAPFGGVISEFVKKLVKTEDHLESCRNAREWVNAFRRDLESWRLSQGVFSEDDELASQAFQNILRQLEMSVSRDLAETVSSALIMERIQHSIETGLFSYKPSGKNRVQVYDVVMALPKEYKVVFVAGLLEKTFPKEVLEDPLWKDEEREKLRKQGAVLEGRALRVSGEKYFFYMALTRARERLYLSYPLKDFEGRPSLPSFFVEEVQKCFAEKVLPLRTVDPVANLLYKNWRSTFEAERGLAFGLFQSDVKTFSAKERSIYSTLALEWAREPRARGILETGYQSGLATLRDPKILDIFKHFEGPFSATRLETYVTCAFKYFSHKILKLESSREGRERLDMGTLLHEVLENFYKELSSTERADVGFWENSLSIEKALLKRLERIFAEKPFDYLPLYRQKIIHEKMKEALALFSEREAEYFKKRGLVPTYFEWEFDKLPLAPGLSLEGKIDRVDVDVAQKKALVVDYKLGKRDIQKKLKQGIELQMPIYLLALEKLLGLEGLGAELRFLEKGEKPEGLYLDEALETLGFHSRKKSYSKESLTALLENIQQNIIEAVQRLRTADISIKSKSCDYCDYQTLCRFEKWKLVYSGVDTDEAG